MEVEALDSGAIAALKKEFQTFLQADDPDSKYSARLTEMMETGKTRLYISVNEMREWKRELTERVLMTPLTYVPIMESAVKELVLFKDPSYFEKVAERNNSFIPENIDKAARICVGFEGNFGENQVTPRSLTADLLGQMVAVEGIVTKCSLVRPKVVRSVHYCGKTKKFESREYRDATDITGLPTGSVYPQKDENGNRLETEFGLCTYKNSQTVTIQEMPESSPLGQLPRSIDCYLEQDLVDRVKPGDRVTIIGMYRAMAATAAQATSGLFRTILLVNSIQRSSREVGVVQLSAGDVSNMRAMGQRPDIFTLLARSLAPSIYGHKYVKQSLALLLLGGVEHNLANGTHIRGDINILMVGDPSTAKSQLLRFVLNIAPLAINTTGRGSTGVGLTAAVTSDSETGERRLEAGAMVLADRGVVCIDEFDKMSEADRVAIHEVMEQQTVTIAKAGIQASLNARCSVVAAANPIYGRFDNTLPLARNVALPDSLLSRFDLVFIVRDRIEEAIDARLAGHVLRMHRYVRPGSEGVPIPLDATAATEAVEEDRAEDAEADTPVYQKYNPLLHGGAAAEAADDKGSSGKKVELLTMEFIRKYISYVKLRYQPKLTDEARGAIVEYYNDFRQRARDRATVITARSLETLIRLSSAHARCCQQKEVRKADVEVARDIMQFALYADAKVRKEEGFRSAGKSKKGPSTGAGAPAGGDAPDEDPHGPSSSGVKRPRPQERRGEEKGREERKGGERSGYDEDGDVSSAKKHRASRVTFEEEEVKLDELLDDEPASLTNGDVVNRSDAVVSQPDMRSSATGLDDGPTGAAVDTRVLNTTISQFFSSNDDGSATIDELFAFVKRKGGAALSGLSLARFNAHLQTLHDDERVLISGGVVHNIS